MEPYEELGVAPTATVAEIRAAYVALAHRFHPDRHPDEGPVEDSDRMARINSAWTLLSDQGRRAAYDASRSGAPGPEEGHATVRDAGDTWVPLHDDEPDPDFLDDTPSGARTLPRIVTMLPVSLFAIGVILVMFGFIVKAAPVLAAGTIFVVGSAAAFLAIPVATMIGASRAERDW